MRFHGESSGRGGTRASASEPRLGNGLPESMRPVVHGHAQSGGSGCPMDRTRRESSMSDAEGYRTAIPFVAPYFSATSRSRELPAARIRTRLRSAIPRPAIASLRPSSREIRHELGVRAVAAVLRLALRHIEVLRRSAQGRNRTEACRDAGSASASAAGRCRKPSRHPRPGRSSPRTWDAATECSALATRLRHTGSRRDVVESRRRS